MTMRLRLGETGSDLVSFGCSPAYEALRSLHVLANVKRHPLHISWALQARTRMSPELKEEAERFAFWYLDRPLVFREIWSPAEISPWDEELEALRDASVAHFAEQLIHGALVSEGRGPRVPLDVFRADPGLQNQALTRIEGRHPASLPALRELIADPAECQRRFAEFLASYWQACIAPDWPRLEAHLLADLTRRGRALSRRGPTRMLEELSPHLNTDHATGEVLISSPGRHADPLDLRLAEHDQLLLLPSHFVWPELTAIAQREPGGRQTILITYALAEMQRQGRAPVPPQDLLKLLRSAGDPTRLQILQLLAQRSRSTREIAGLIGLTEAAISKHLKLLHEAGWVKPERHSYYVYYALVRDSIDQLGQGLEDMLG